MDLQRYRLFVDLAETGNLTRTGERMGYTQSGVSRFLKNMEKELGFVLFNRTRRGLTLSDAGRALLPSAKELLKSGEQLEQTIRALNGVETGSVSIGVFTGISIRLLPDILKEFLDQAPNITLKTREGGIREIRSWLQDGTVDFALCTRCSHMEWYPLWEEQLMAVLGKSDALGRQGSVTLKTLVERPLILPSRDTDEDIGSLLEKSGLHCIVRSEAADGYAVLSMVKSGLGCGILPSLIVGESEVTALPLDPPAFRALGICVRSDENATPAARQLMNCIRAHKGRNLGVEDIPGAKKPVSPSRSEHRQNAGRGRPKNTGVPFGDLQNCK